MSYAQKNYLELQGIPTAGHPLKYRISQIGCFLTSFSNLLERFGKGVDPLQLNRIFRERGVYIDVDDGVRDDLFWQAVTSAFPQIVCNQTGTGAPPHNNAIVKFITKTNNFGTHFCTVADRNAGTIIDSWDGQVKSWNVYGGPKAWAAYADATPQPVPAPKPTPKPTPAPAPTGANYDGTFITVQAGWGVSHAAQAAGYPDWASEARWNAIAQLNGQANVSTFKLHAGQRIKVGKYTPPAPAPKPVTPPVATPVKPPVSPTLPPKEGDKIPVKVVPVDHTAYQKTYEPEEVLYIAEEDAAVMDFTGLHINLDLKAGQKVNTTGTFIKDGVRYARVLTTKPENADAWYAVPITVLEKESEAELFSTDTIHEARELLHNLSNREKIVALVGKVQVFFISLLAKLKIKKVD